MNEIPIDKIESLARFILRRNSGVNPLPKVEVKKDTNFIKILIYFNKKSPWVFASSKHVEFEVEGDFDKALYVLLYDLEMELKNYFDYRSLK